MMQVYLVSDRWRAAAHARASSSCSSGRRTIQFKGKLHMQVHRLDRLDARRSARPLHGLFALHTFFGWPF